MSARLVAEAKSMSDMQARSFDRRVNQSLRMVDFCKINTII